MSTAAVRRRVRDAAMVESARRQSLMRGSRPRDLIVVVGERVSVVLEDDGRGRGKQASQIDKA